MNAEKYRHLGFVNFLIIIVKLLKYQKLLDFFIFFQLKLSFAFRIHRVPLPDHDIHAAVNALFGAIFVRWTFIKFSVEKQFYLFNYLLNLH